MEDHREVEQLFRHAENAADAQQYRQIIATTMDAGDPQLRRRFNALVEGPYRTRFDAADLPTPPPARLATARTPRRKDRSRRATASAASALWYVTGLSRRFGVDRWSARIRFVAAEVVGI